MLFFICARVKPCNQKSAGHFWSDEETNPKSNGTQTYHCKTRCFTKDTNFESFVTTSVCLRPQNLIIRLGFWSITVIWLLTVFMHVLKWTSALLIKRLHGQNNQTSTLTTHAGFDYHRKQIPTSNSDPWPRSDGWSPYKHTQETVLTLLSVCPHFI